MSRRDRDLLVSLMLGGLAIVMGLVAVIFHTLHGLVT